MQYRLVLKGRDWEFEVPVPDGDEATILDAAHRNLPDHLGVGTNAEPRIINRDQDGGTITMMGHEIHFTLTPI
jgi:hypothetical protein